MFARDPKNPLITPANVPPSRPDCEVLCAFNPAATRLNGQTLLLLRVAERPIPEPGWVSTFVWNPEAPEGGLELIRVREDDPDLSAGDPRCFSYKGELYLTSLSHIRIAREQDNGSFVADAAPALMPTHSLERYGIEDPRITELDGVFYISYSAVSPVGVTTTMARTTDFATFERMDTIFAPDNKDVAIFPEVIDGCYFAFHRPSTKHLGEPSIWLASSNDLLHWGRHRLLIGPRPGRWDCERVGAGAAPILTERGWLSIYHASDHNVTYRLGALLLDRNDPSRVLARSEKPIFSPEVEYETKGFLSNVVFTNGHVFSDVGNVEMYYGAADWVTCRATVHVNDLLASMD